MADDAAAVAAAAAETNNNNNNNNNNEQGGGNGFIIGLAGNILRSGVGILKWAGEAIGEPVEQGGGGQQEDGAPPQQAEVEPAPPLSSGEDPPGSASDTAELVDGAPSSADDGLAMAPNQLGAEAGPVDGAEPAAKVGREEGQRILAGAMGSTHGRAAADLIHPLESRCFWGLILALVFAGVVLGVVACHFFPVLAGASAGGARVCTGREPALVREGNRNFQPGDSCRLTVSTEQCGLAGLEFDVHLPAEVVKAAWRDATRAERRRVAQENYAARAERKRGDHDNYAERTESKRRGFRFWKGNTGSEGSGGSNGSSNGSNGGSSSSSSSRGSSKTGSGSGPGSSSDEGRDGRGAFSKAFRAFSSWREKHRDAAQELLDGPWV